MTMHTTTVSAAHLDALLTTIRISGGLVTSSKPDSGRVRVTWQTPDYH